MTINILSTGKSALAAAQVGIATAGHNIANAATPGYSRQTVVQSEATPQYFGFGFIGHGVQISTVKRIYGDFLGTQVNAAQASQSELGTYGTQISQIDNLLADQAAGLSPAVQDFFNGVQTLASDPGSASAREAMLSSAQSLATRFNGLDDRLDEIAHGVNEQIKGSIGAINSYAQQIAQLNDTIARSQNSTGKPANDLLDQRDQLVNELSKEVKVAVVRQDGGNFNIFIGGGLPLVVGNSVFSMTAAPSRTDPTRIEPAYLSDGKTVLLSESSVTGGNLGAVIRFRFETLDPTQNALGRIAIGLAESFNAQHRLGQDLLGQPGADFFKSAAPEVDPSNANTGSGRLAATITDSNALTTSDYRLKYDGASYTLTRASDGKVQSFTGFPQTVDGVKFDLSSGTLAAGDEYLVRPTVNGAADFGAAISDVNKIAAAAPIRTARTSGNGGSATIDAGAVDSSYSASPLTVPLTISYSGATNTLTGFPASAPVTVSSGGSTTTYAVGAAVGYVDGATLSFGGVSFTMAGAPANGDSFTIGPNTSGVGDGRNGLLLAGLQTRNTLANGTTSYQGAYAQVVSQIGNKAREIQTTGAAADRLLDSATSEQQSLSGVNLDEEAADLLRYQQAYQAAGKVMQTASTLFDVILSLGN